MHIVEYLSVRYISPRKNGAIVMKVLNILLIICAFLLLLIGLETPGPTEAENSTIKQSINFEEFDPRPNIVKVMEELYPM